MLGLFLALGFVVAIVQKQFILPPSLRYPLYDVTVLDEPVPDLERYQRSQVVSLTHEGQPVNCVIPQVNAEAANAELKVLDNETLLANARAAISPLLNVVYVSTSDDIWGWFMSFNSTVVQFLPARTEQPGVIEISPEKHQVSVGSPGDKPGQNLQTAEPVVVDDKHMMMATFINGTTCDLTGQPRISRLFFTCDPEAVKGPVLKSVQEPYACVYELVIGTNRLCSFPEFADPQVQPNRILCGPARFEDAAKRDEL